MYNLLVTATLGAWDEPFYEFDKSRFLEYTNESISEAFKTLSSSLIESLKSYPCIFAYEGDSEGFRIGRLTSIKEEGRKLIIKFELDKNIPSIPYNDIKPIATLLDIRNWEMNRTHWAVKDEDLFEHLLDKNILVQNQIEKTSKQEKPLVKRSNNPKVATVQGFIKKVLLTVRENDTEVFYRGHSSKNRYKLEPSLFRKDSDGNYLYLDNEHIIYRELMVSNSKDFQSDEYTLDSLVRMQHYSLPTRLLDITSNPLIALYFACKTSIDEDGEVILFSMSRSEVKYFDSDVASCISNLARLPKQEKDNINLEDKDFNNQTSVKRLLHLIREDKPYFEPKIIPNDLMKIICVKGKKSNDRISSQSGAFLLYGIDAVMNEEGTSEISVNRITVSNKASMLKELDLLNINDSTVFPNIENSAKYVADKYKFNKPLQQESS